MAHANNFTGLDLHQGLRTAPGATEADFYLTPYTALKKEREMSLPLRFVRAVLQCPGLVPCLGYSW